MTDHMDVLGTSKTALQGLEIAQANVQWVKNNYETIINWLQDQQPTQPPVVQSTLKPMTTTPSSASSYNAKIFVPLSAIVVLRQFLL